MKITLTGVDSLTQSLKSSVEKAVKDLSEQVHSKARSNTPVKSGNARSNWQKKLSPNNFSIINQVPYIERLEAGASKQAPKGIIGPTLSQIKGK
jgi:HK97 gp10 family phage protein